MDKEKFVFHFKKHEIATSDKSNDVEITNVLKPATQDVTNAELKIVAKEIEASCSQRDSYQKTIPSTIKKEVGSYALVNGTAAAIKKFSLKYTKYTFNRTTVNSDRWARGLIKKFNWSKRKGTTSKVEPSLQFLAEEKFSFQK